MNTYMYALRNRQLADITVRLILAGRGHETPAQLREAGDPLAMAYSATIACLRILDAQRRMRQARLDMLKDR